MIGRLSGGLQMKFGINIPPFGEYGDPRKLAQLAREAEDAGWDGFFIWDHIMFDPTFHPIVDPWVGLAAIALNTEHLRIGTLVTPVARRRPWKLARETVSVDLLSNGRLVLGIGLGDPVQWDYGFFGEEQDAKIRAQKLDEGLDILKGLWTGKPFRYDGTHYHLNEVTFQPTPVQSPRIPVWVGGNWDKPAPQRRAARWDGYHPIKWGDPLTSEEWKVIQQTINEQRDSNAPFDWVHSGMTPGDDSAKAAALVRPYADIGITWWIEAASPFDFGADWEKPLTPEATALMEKRIRQGPPKG
jgi:alkanesulfonate monooxygenase SsuD/methylene tetrahydromethanopterin reductase-like flavin-dependent oxidoreductase (luciferase family)